MPTYCFKNWLFVGGQVFQQSGRIPMGTESDFLFVDLILYSYKTKFIQKRPYDKSNFFALTFNLIFQYINDVSIFQYIEDALSIENNLIPHICRCDIPRYVRN
jgi:hypothetical protein